MFSSDKLKQTDVETFMFNIPKDKDYRILQLTDLHFKMVPLGSVVSTRVRGMKED